MNRLTLIVLSLALAGCESRLNPMMDYDPLNQVRTMATVLIANWPICVLQIVLAIIFGMLLAVGPRVMK